MASRAEVPDLRGRVVVITGGNAGIGREAAAQLAAAGARVVITARDRAKGEAALESIRSTGPAGEVELASLDLASFASIEACAADLLDRCERIDVLIENAGGILSERRETAEGFEMTFGVNHLGHFLLTELLLDRLLTSAPARVVVVSSLAHRFALTGVSFADLQRTNGYNATLVYNESKLANLLFTAELARRLEGTGVTVNACHPGAVRSGFGSPDDTRGLERAVMALARPFLISSSAGARPLVHLASSPAVEGVTGAYFSGGLLPGVRQSTPSRAARDTAAAARLWEVSEALVAEGRARTGGDPLEQP